MRGLLITALLFLAFLPERSSVAAEERRTDTTKGDSIRKITAYLGGSDLHGGNVPKRTFDSLLKLGIQARDSLGNVYPVSGFYFTYAERTLYEDSVGNLMVLNDYIYEYCRGDSVSRTISLNIYHKTKPGDTAYFDQIKVIDDSGATKEIQSMKFTLTR